MEKTLIAVSVTFSPTVGQIAMAALKITRSADATPLTSRKRKMRVCSSE